MGLQQLNYNGKVLEIKSLIAPLQDIQLNINLGEVLQLIHGFNQAYKEHWNFNDSDRVIYKEYNSAKELLLRTGSKQIGSFDGWEIFASVYKTEDTDILMVSVIAPNKAGKCVNINSGFNHCENNLEYFKMKEIQLLERFN